MIEYETLTYAGPPSIGDIICNLESNKLYIVKEKKTTSQKIMDSVKFNHNYIIESYPSEIPPHSINISWNGSAECFCEPRRDEKSYRIVKYIAGSTSVSVQLFDKFTRTLGDEHDILLDNPLTAGDYSKPPQTENYAYSRNYKTTISEEALYLFVTDLCKVKRIWKPALNVMAFDGLEPIRRIQEETKMFKPSILHSQI
jgi:hypothetical protein